MIITIQNCFTFPMEFRVRSNDLFKRIAMRPHVMEVKTTSRGKTNRKIGISTVISLFWLNIYKKKSSNNKNSFDDLPDIKQSNRSKQPFSKQYENDM